MDRSSYEGLDRAEAKRCKEAGTLGAFLRRERTGPSICGPTSLSECGCRARSVHSGDANSTALVRDPQGLVLEVLQCDLLS
jgi:hypothetical protein